MSCSPVFSLQEDGTYKAFAGEIPGIDNRYVKIQTDTQHLNYIKKVQNASSKAVIETIQFCDFENGSSLFHSRTYNKVGETSFSTITFGEIDVNGKVKPVYFSENSLLRTPYASCTDLLAYTKNNDAYYRCADGDGGYGAVIYYKVNFKSDEQKAILKCTAISTDNGTDDYKTTVSCN